MSINILLIIGALLVSMLCGFVAIPSILDYCKDKNLYDVPNARKMHKTLVPRLGGVSFMPSMVLAFVMAVLIMSDDHDHKFVQVNLWSLYFLVGLLIIYSVGLVDDLIGLSANIKFVVQIIAAAILPLSNLYINNLYGLFGIHAVPFWVGAPITVFVIVFVCNAFNLIDGIDGLCAGLAEVALAGFMYLFFMEGLYVYCILIAGLMGVLIPYIFYNLFGRVDKGRKIFMGDSGSLTLGFILGFLFVKYSMCNPQVMCYVCDRMPSAYTLLIIPTFDVVRVVLHRLRARCPIFDADKNHIHHKMMRAGLTMHQALLVILGLALAYIALNMAVYPWVGFTGIFVLDIVLYTALHEGLNVAIKHRETTDRTA